MQCIKGDLNMNYMLRYICANMLEGGTSRYSRIEFNY